MATDEKSGLDCYALLPSRPYMQGGQAFERNEEAAIIERRKGGRKEKMRDPGR